MTKRNVVHIEIPSKDPQASAKFYESLFGWKMHHMAEMNYTMFDPTDGPGGGFTSEVENSVLIYINSEDIDADLKKAKSLGAEIIQEKKEIPQSGWFGIFKDPQGASVALYTSMNPDSNK